MDGMGDGVPISNAQLMGGTDIDAAAHAQKKACKQTDQKGGGAHGAQCLITGKLSGDGNVAKVEQHLENLREH